MQIDVTPPPTESQEAADTPTSQPTQSPAATLAPEVVGTEAVVVNVIDQTGGALLAQGLQIELAGFEEFELVYEDSVSLSSQSQVIFTEVPLPAGRVYFASISYQGAVYRSQIVEVGPDTDVLELTIQLYETTTSAEALVIDRVHLLVDFPSPDYVQFIEIYIMSNLGEATVVSADPGQPTVSFPLPEGAESIEFDNGTLGQRYLQTEDGFGDTVSIPPGSGVYQVLVYYQLPVRRDKLNFSQEMSYPVQAVIAMTPAGEGTIKGSNLEDAGIQTIPSGSVQIYSGGFIAKGDSLDFRLSIDSGETALAEDSASFLPRDVVIGLGVAGGLVFAIGIWLFLRQRGVDLGEGEEPALADEREQILDSIIALEDLYKEGEIAEKDYQKKRQEYKERLKAFEEEVK